MYEPSPWPDAGLRMPALCERSAHCRRFRLMWRGRTDLLVLWPREAGGGVEHWQDSRKMAVGTL